MASGSCQARDESLTDRIRNLREHNRDGPRLGRRRWRAGSKEDIGRHAYEFLREGVHAVDIASGVAVVDLDIASLGPSKRGERVHKLRDGAPVIRVAFETEREYADPPHPLGLLRARRQRPYRGRAAEQRYERAALHSITSSARSRNDSGIVSPSAWAVVRLMTRSNLVGCSIGISLGFAPRRIWSTRSAERRYRSGKFGP